MSDGDGPLPRTKAEAMLACGELHEKLLRCYDAGGSWCREESKRFWDCYREQKGDGAVRFDFMRLFGAGSKAPNE